MLVLLLLLLLIQFPVHAWEGTGRRLKQLAPVIHVGDQDKVLSSWLWPSTGWDSVPLSPTPAFGSSSAVAVLRARGGNQKVEALLLNQIHKYMVFL